MCVCCHIQKQHSSRSTTAGTVFRALAFVPVVAVDVCGWRTAGDRSTTTSVSRPKQHSNTPDRISYQVHGAYSSIKNSSLLVLLQFLIYFFCSFGTTLIHIIGKAVFPLFDLRRPPGYHAPTSKRNLARLCKRCTFVSACCSPAAILFFSRVRLRGKQGDHRYIATLSRPVCDNISPVCWTISAVGYNAATDSQQHQQRQQQLQRIS